MLIENPTLELETIAQAFLAISQAACYRGVAEAFLKAALEYSRAVRGAVILSAGSELLGNIDTSFLRETAKIFVSYPQQIEFRLPEAIEERVLICQEVVITHNGRINSALADPGGCPCGQDRIQLYLPVVHREQTIGVLYLESESRQKAFTSKCISALSMLALQAALSFKSAQLLDALRETSMWMIRGQTIGRIGSYRWNTRTQLTRASRQCYRIFNIDPDLNPVPFEVFKSRVHPDDFPGLERVLVQAASAKAPLNHEYRVVHEDGTILTVVAVGQFDLGPSGDLELEGIITDVTERKTAEQALVDARADLARAARLASLGELAGAIVHEVKQPMTGIIASASACLRWLAREPADVDEARKSVARIIQSACRANKVVSGLRSLVRDGQLQFARLGVEEVIEGVLLLLKRELERASIKLKTNFDKSIPYIEGDQLQLQQVVLNLVRNAIDAMCIVTEGDRALTISSKFVGGQAIVTIADTGAGIDPASKKHLFEALYTTKPEGLGLGLSICRKIIAAHGGRLWLESTTTFGTVFAFALPLHQSTNISEII